MIRFIIKRILLIIPVLLGISLLIFTMLYFTPGDPTIVIMPQDATEEARAQMRHELGLDRPFWVRYGEYLKNIVTKLDFGTSYTTRQSVSVELFQKFPFTLKLAFLSAIVATVFGVILGIVSAVRQYTIFDNLSTVIGLAAYSMPIFWLGMLLIIVFAVNLRWLPSSGVATWKGWILPAVTIGTNHIAKIMRMTRSSMLEVMRQDYITTARAKGLEEREVIFKHAFGNAFIPVITTIGLTFGQTLGGAVVTERVFSIPGIGMFMVDSIRMLNYPVVQGAVLLTAFSFSMMNLLIDILYAFIDPRIKAQYMKKKKHKVPVTAKGAVQS
ncbi:ABC transporter permease [Breznakiella homolactica]|uniref:ABC transporter permease n=1 Tax=Breznakiella homolactica TaxID=2798577 RepID=A0A7T7XM73_9SPIR|nr:ABC transporter permease [Breznakiella homolactica]QQO08832.1 ABC transporter permease [Breznakiella homolactica]